jgi:hypothetical protein
MRDFTPSSLVAAPTLPYAYFRAPETLVKVELRLDPRP